MKPFDLFASCLPGLEALLAAEITELGIGVPVVSPGGVSFQGHRRAVYRANLELGLATRVLVRIGEFTVTSFPELVRETAALAWDTLLVPGTPFDVRAVCKRSKLYHSGGVEERVALGILERLEDAPQLDDADDDTWPTVHVRFVADHCTISLDSSGEALHRRGYRLDGRKAPLREDLARALVLASGWDRASPLVDPFAGAGTIAIEAAQLARGLAPGRLRSFAFERTRLFDAADWKRVRDAAAGRERELAETRVFASDRDTGAVAACAANAARAGLGAAVDARCCAVSDAPFLSGAPAAGVHGAVVTNPPFGTRIGKGDLRSLYQALGARIRALPAGWRVALLAADARLARATGIDLTTAFLSDHGGRKVRALTGAC